MSKHNRRGTETASTAPVATDVETASVGDQLAVTAEVGVLVVEAKALLSTWRQDVWKASIEYEKAHPKHFYDLFGFKERGVAA